MAVSFLRKSAKSGRRQNNRVLCRYHLVPKVQQGRRHGAREAHRKHGTLSRPGAIHDGVVEPDQQNIEAALYAGTRLES